ncbi:hemolysin secretion protein D [Alphaproteobacteria bacterium]|nr:hemolysin secretion protein D [Alphaproteobacteria bacterium]
MAAKLKVLALTALVLASGFFAYKSVFVKQDEIVLNGNVEIQDVSVSFRVAGRIKSVFVNEGDNVKKGALLAVIDSDIFEAISSFSQAKLTEAEINFNNAKKDYERNFALFRQKNVSEKIYDDSFVSYKTARAHLDGAIAGFRLAEINRKDAILKAPVDGTILTRNIEPGEMISSGTPAFSIMPAENQKVKTFANEKTLTQIKTNDKVLIHLESLPEKSFKGHIGFISPDAEFTPKNIETTELRTSLVYRIRIVMDEFSPELKQGMPVTVKLETQQ